MKNILKFGVSCLALVSVMSCSDIEDERVSTVPVSAPVLKTPAAASTFVLQKANADQIAATFSWDPAVYNGANTPVVYDVELVVTRTDASGNAIQEIVPVISTKKTSVDLKVSDFNTALTTGAELKPNIPVDVAVRVSSSLGDVKMSSQASQSNAITVTPYPAWPDWGIIGSHIPDTGWSSDRDMEYNSATDTYSITLDMIIPASDLGYKFRLDNAWNVNLGGSSVDKLVMNGPNLKISEAGNYTITLKVTKKGETYTGVSTITKN